MAAPYLPSPNPDIDYLLALIVEALQLTNSQYALAAQHYGAVAEWLKAPESPLVRFRPVIYPQGSMAIETTVRPWRQEEYDLDLVCQMLATGMTALEVYEAVYDRLMASRTYAPMVERKKRCVRLIYAHDFHLDIIPAEPDTMRGGIAIRVPDRALRGWTPSNPLGYVAWFKHRSQIGLTELQRGAALPGPTPVAEKPPLAIVVQLIKRRRDLFFDDVEVAPRSVVLTTLAGEHYRGTNHIAAALHQIVLGIQQRIRDAGPNRITVCNPTNDGERFCESFEGPGRYDAFKRFINQLEIDARGLLTTSGIPALQKALAALFGDDPVSKAVRSYGELQKTQRDQGTLKFSGAGTGGLAIVAGSANASRPVPANRYFGGER